jgi:RimJ/RimL family protein N-acetyltransferase
VASELELLYALRPDLWGRGLAAEAARKCIDWLFQTQPISRLLAGADPANERSQRVLERLGFVAIDEPLIGLEHMRYYALARPEGGSAG